MLSKLSPVKSNTKSCIVVKPIATPYLILIILIGFFNQANAQSLSYGYSDILKDRYDRLYGNIYTTSSYTTSLWTQLRDGNIGFIFPEGNDKRVGVGTDNPQYTLDVNGTIRTNGNLRADKLFARSIDVSEILLDGKSFSENPTSSWKLLRGGDIGFVFPDGNDNRVGIGTDNPLFTLDVNGTIHTDGNMVLSGIDTYKLYGEEYQPSNVTTGRILIPGPTSQYLIGVQDGNGRIQHKWNATSGTNEKFLVGNENASFMNWNGGVSNSRWFEFKFADGTGKSAGDSIDWQTHFSIEKNGNVGIGMTTTPTEKLEVNGNIKTTKLFTNYIEAKSDSRFKQDVYVEGIISVDEAVYTPRVITSGNAKFVNLEVGKTILPDGGIASTLTDPTKRIVIFSGNGEEANVSFAPDRTTLYKNVGINKIPNPNYDLDVDGVINASGILINGESIASTWVKIPDTTGDLVYDFGNVTIGNTQIEGSNFNLNVAGNVTGTLGDFQNLKIKDKEINFDGYADKTAQQAFQAFTLSALAAIGVNEAFDYFTDKPLEIVDAFTDIVDGVSSLKPQNVKCTNCVKKNTSATLKKVNVTNLIASQKVTTNNLIANTSIRAPRLHVGPKNSDWKSQWDSTTANDERSYEMVVEGDFIAQRIAVAANFETFKWPDYVFKADYELPSLESVETFIKAKKHLPNVPSEKEVKEEGLDLAEINAILLRKIEELTLYAIDQNKRMNKLEASLKKN